MREPRTVYQDREYLGHHTEKKERCLRTHPENGLAEVNTVSCEQENQSTLDPRGASSGLSRIRPSSHRVSGSRTAETDVDTSELYALPPWPEWSDAEVNAERWHVYDKRHKRSLHRERSGSHTRPSSFPMGSQFEDPMGHAPLPSSLQPDSWRRLYTIANMTVFHDELTHPPLIDLATPNSHLLHSEVMRWILAGIMNLYQLGREHNLELEGENHAFFVHAHPWKPWHHIYCMNKVTKDHYNKPVVNPGGKYVVRLFYMGCWRRITVDDFLPLDEMRRPLLPMSASGDEMWPALLTKALLKVASLSWTEDREIQDFSVMACLTGWHAQELDLHEVPSRTIWCLCQKLLMSDSADKEDHCIELKDRSVSEQYTLDSSVHINLEPAFADTSGGIPSSVILSAVVHTLPAGLSPCVEHPILITGTKIDIDPNNEIRPPTPLWKTFRWKKWALEQGIITAEEPEKFIKSIRMFSSLQNCLPNMHPVATIPSMVDLVQLLHKYRKQHTSSTLQKPTVAVPEGDGTLKKGTTKSRRHAKAEDKNKDTVFPEMWIKFEKIVHCIKRFEIYYRTKSFEHNLKVTDILHIPEEKTITIIHRKHHRKESKPSASSMISSQNAGKGKAEILYLLMDSLTCKRLIISLSVLKPGVKLPRLSHRLQSSSTVDEEGGNGDNSVPPPVMYYILGESYDCQSKQIQDIKFAIKTVATRCHLLQLQEGRAVIRLWMKLPEVYAIRISSQMPFILGNREVIEEALASETLSWKQYGTNFSSAFTALSNMKLYSPQHEELLENLHKSYLPPFIPKYHFPKTLKRTIHSKFEDALVSLLLETTGDTDTIAKTILKWKWLFRRDDFGSASHILSEIGDDFEIHSASKLYEDTVMKISSGQGTTSVHGSEHHDTDRNHLKAVASQHSKLISFDEKSGIEFLRRMLGNDPEVIKYYPFRNDDKNRIFFTDYKGVLNNVTEEWIPLVRFVVNTHSNTFPHCALYLSTTLPDGVIQFINNDTLETFSRCFGDIEPSYIPTNCDGYTVFAYGKSDGQYSRDQHDHSWKIRFVSAGVEESQLPHACSWITTAECLPQEPPQLTIKEIKGNYMPYTDNTIFKCILTLHKTQHLTVRAVMSNKAAEFALRITDEDGEVIREYHATGEIVIPVVQLQGRDFNGLDFYVIEAQLLGKTWILTAEELQLVNKLRDKALQMQIMFREEKLKEKRTPKGTSRKRSSSRSANPPTVEFISDAPHWKLMIIVDEELSSTVTIEKDQRRQQQIEEMKTEWELTEPGRSKKSYQIRQSNLNRNPYCSYLHDYIHEQGLAPGEKTSYLLQYFSFKESEYQPDTYELYSPTEASRYQTEKIDFDYGEIRKMFKEMNLKQIRTHRLIRNHLSKTIDESNEMIEQAYTERNARVEYIKRKRVVATKSTGK